MLAYFNSAMLLMYQVDSYALDLLAYFNYAMLSMYQIDSYALDLLAYTLILLLATGARASLRVTQSLDD
jgi:hypothetical protein